jgi:hypothetical protein
MTVKLEYLVGSREMSDQSPSLKNVDCRMWNIKTKTHPRYQGTFGVAGLKEIGVIDSKEVRS